MYYFGRTPRERTIPEPLVGPFQRFIALVGIAFLASTVSPATVGSYPGSLEEAHGGRLLLYAVVFLVGLLGLHIGDEFALPYARRSWPREAAHLAGLGAVGLALAAPFLVAYRAWTAASWEGWALATAYIAFVLGCATVAGAGLTVVLKLDERRLVGKYVLLGLIMLMPLLAPIPLSPLLAVADMWEGATMRAAPGYAIPAAAALLSLGVMLWKRRWPSSAGRCG